MNESTVDLDDLDLEGQQAPESTETLETTETPEKTPDQLALEELRGRMGGLEAKAALIDQFGPLLPSVKAALEKFTSPAPTSTEPDPEVFRQVGERLQQTLVTGKPEDAGRLFFEAIREISSRTTNAAIDKVGGPVVDRVADFTLSSYLNMRRETEPEKAATHGLIAKEIKLSTRDRQVLGSSPADEARELLDERYEQAAGRVLLRGKPRVRDIGGGGTGGGARGGALTTAPPGFTQAEWAQQLRMLEINYPDEKVRAGKLKELRADFTSEAV
jgi:hypothetical protein